MPLRAPIRAYTWSYPPLPDPAFSHQPRRTVMSIAKVTEIIAESTEGFDDAVRVGIKRATKTLENVTSAWVQDQTVKVEDGKIIEYRVHLKVTFVLKS
jgi:flavin-binding protein dodecin